MLSCVGAADLRHGRGGTRDTQVVGHAHSVLVRLLQFEVNEVEAQLADVAIDSVDGEGACACPCVGACVSRVDKVGVVVARRFPASTRDW